MASTTNYVEIGGKKVGIKYGMLAIQHVADKNVSVSTGGFASLSSVVNIIYGGYRNWCYVKDIPEELSFEEIYDWVEERSIVGDKELSDLVAAFGESQVVKSLIEKTKENTPEQKKTKGSGLKK
jgi:hypothetical protein